MCFYFLVVVGPALFLFFFISSSGDSHGPFFSPLCTASIVLCYFALRSVFSVQKLQHDHRRDAFAVCCCCCSPPKKETRKKQNMPPRKHFPSFFLPIPFVIQHFLSHKKSDRFLQIVQVFAQGSLPTDSRSCTFLGFVFFFSSSSIFSHKIAGSASIKTAKKNPQCP